MKAVNLDLKEFVQWLYEKKRLVGLTHSPKLGPFSVFLMDKYGVGSLSSDKEIILKTRKISLPDWAITLMKKLEGKEEIWSTEIINTLYNILGQEELDTLLYGREEETLESYLA